MQTKLPGHDQAQKLVKLYRQAGFSNLEIADQLVMLEEVIMAELICEIEKGMSEEAKRQFGEFLADGPTPEEIAQFLNLNKEELTKKIEQKIQVFVDQLEEDLTKANLSLEELRSALNRFKLPSKEKRQKAPDKL